MKAFLTVLYFLFLCANVVLWLVIDFDAKATVKRYLKEGWTVPPEAKRLPLGLKLKTHATPIVLTCVPILNIIVFFAIVLNYEMVAEFMMDSAKKMMTPPAATE
jgi:hypothetical protein